MECKYCKSENVIKKENEKGKQRHYCKGDYSYSLKDKVYAKIELFSSKNI